LAALLLLASLHNRCKDQENVAIGGTFGTSARPGITGLENGARFIQLGSNPDGLFAQMFGFSS